MMRLVTLTSALIVSALAVGPVHSETIKLAGVAMIAGVLALRMRANSQRTEAWLLTGVVASTWLASVVALEPMTSVLGTLDRAQGALAALGLGVLALSAADLRAEQRYRFYVATAAVGGLIGLYAVLQRLGLDPWAWVDTVPGRPAATLSNAVVVGGYLTLCLPLSIWLLLSAISAPTINRVACMLLAIATASQLGGLIASGTRSAMLALFITGTVLLLRRGRLRVWLLPTLLLAGLVIAWSASHRLDSLGDRAQLWASATRALQSSLPLRDLKGSADAMHAWRGIIGFGPDLQQIPLRTARSDSALVRAQAAELQADRAHQWLLDRLLEAGWLGLMSSLAFAGFVAWRLREAIVDVDVAIRAEALALAVALGAFALHLQVNFALTGDRTLAWILIGCVLGLPRRGLSASAPLRAQPIALFAIQVGIAAVLFAGAVAIGGGVRGLNPAMDAEREFLAGQQRYVAAMADSSQAAAQSFAQSAQYFEAAGRLRRFDTDAALAAASAWIEAAQSAMDPKPLESARYWLSAARAIDPREPRLKPIDARLQAVTLAIATIAEQSSTGVRDGG